MIEDYTPPHSTDAEQSVIGSILIRPEVLDDIATLKPENFYNAAHREIYGVMLSMSKAGKTIDVITVAETISDAGKDDVTGGLAYLGQICSNVPSAANAKRYAEIVQLNGLKEPYTIHTGQILKIPKK